MSPDANFVDYEGLVLPPPGIPRHGGKTDELYVFYAKDNVRRAQELAGLTADDRVIDIGCGAGRFLTGMLATFGSVNKYVGLDVKKLVIDWCATALTDKKNGDIRFEWVNVENPRYNKDSAPESASRFRLPAEDESMDLAVLFSVFSHMTFEDTAAYLHEIARVLDSGGRCYCTAFVEDDVERWVENPDGYLQEWKGPLHCVRFNRKAFEDLAAQAGLTVSSFSYRSQPMKQSAYVLRKA